MTVQSISTTPLPTPAANPTELAAFSLPNARQGAEPGLPQYPGAFKPLSREDVAAVLGISIRTLENWVKQGRLPPPTSIAGRRYWHPARFYAALTSMLQPEDAASGQSPSGAAAVRDKPPKVEESAAGKRAKQASQEKTEALLRQVQAAAQTEQLASA
jgi:DNA-binding transcriptional MerR regulator